MSTELTTDPIRVFLIDEEYYAASTRKDAIRCHCETCGVTEDQISEVEETPMHMFHYESGTERPMIEEAMAIALGGKPLPFYFASQNA